MCCTIDPKPYKSKKRETILLKYKRHTTMKTRSVDIIDVLVPTSIVVVVDTGAREYNRCGQVSAA